MTKVRTWVGLDVHAGKVVACVVDAESGEMSVRRLPGDTSNAVASAPGFRAQRASPMRLARRGSVFPGRCWRPGSAVWSRRRGRSSVPRRIGSRRTAGDAERLVRLLMIDGLHAVRVPTGEEEALRDLVRAREDIPGDLMRARHRMGKLLLRHDVRYDGTSDHWSHRHRQWLSMVRLPERGAQATLLDYLGAIDTLVIRRDQVEATISELVPDSPWAQDVARLRCMRGIDTLTAIGLCAEISDFARFEHPNRLMSYVGLVPSERSSGQSRRQGAITKSGSQHARRLLVEAAWC